MQQRVCDRCKRPITEMERYRLTFALFERYHQENQKGRDLCLDCGTLLLDFMEGEAIPPLKERKDDSRE